MIISFRHDARFDLHQDHKIKELWHRKFFVRKQAEDTKSKMESAKSQEEYDALKTKMIGIDKALADIEYEIHNIVDPDDPIRIQRENDIKKDGFALTNHCDIRYNERFLPYLTLEQLRQMLIKLGLGKKVNPKTDQSINLLPNFFAELEEGFVKTFKYDNSYFAGKDTPKYNLGKIEDLLK